MVRQQRAQWNSSPLRHASHVGADNKASKHRFETLHRGSSSGGSHDELFESEESRSRQLRMQLNPRGHLQDVLDNAALEVKESTQQNLRAPKTMRAPDPLVGVQGTLDAKGLGRKFLQSPASTMRDVNLAAPPQGGSFSPSPLRPTSELWRLALAKDIAPMEDGFARVGSPFYNDATDAFTATPLLSPARIPRKWSEPARNPKTDARPAFSQPPPERIRISWLPLARSFTSEFFPERSPPPLPSLRHSASVPLRPKPASFETSSALKRASKTDSLRENATKLLPTRLSRIVDKLSAPVNCDE